MFSQTWKLSSVSSAKEHVCLPGNVIKEVSSKVSSPSSKNFATIKMNWWQACFHREANWGRCWDVIYVCLPAPSRHAMWIFLHLIRCISGNRSWCRNFAWLSWPSKCASLFYSLWSAFSQSLRNQIFASELMFARVIIVLTTVGQTISRWRTFLPEKHWLTCFLRTNGVVT